MFFSLLCHYICRSSHFKASYGACSLDAWVKWRFYPRVDPRAIPQRLWQDTKPADASAPAANTAAGVATTEAPVAQSEATPKGIASWHRLFRTFGWNTMFDLRCWRLLWDPQLGDFRCLFFAEFLHTEKRIERYSWDLILTILPCLCIAV